MLDDLRLEEEFFALLAGLDAEIAGSVAQAGCQHCGGPLHQANYERKPRGGLFAGAGEAFTLRHSFCCGREGCRKRATPPSLRFLGRRVYLGAVVFLASVVAQLSAALREARAVTGVPGRTLRRWGGWWRSAFPETPTWIALRARFRPPPPNEASLPASLRERIETDLGSDSRSASVADVAVRVARLLAPLTTLSVTDGSRFVGGLGAELGAG